jgi:hypothetical protein
MLGGWPTQEEETENEVSSGESNPKSGFKIRSIKKVYRESPASRFSSK